MSIKNVKPTKKSRFIQGYFNPKFIEKYIGPKPIIYRSSWERKFMIWCDGNDKVISWSSEPVEIKYIHRVGNKVRKYYPDFYFKQLQKNGGFKEYLVEIKPKSQILKPNPPTKTSRKALNNYKFLVEQYIKNTDKYKAAREYSTNRGWDFIILTEDTIKNGLR